MANTGNITVTERDMNPLSPTYNTTRTRTYQDFTRCIPDGVKIYFTTDNNAYQTPCNESTVLRFDDITRWGVSIQSVRSASIGNCVTAIGSSPNPWSSGPSNSIFQGAIRLRTAVMADSVHLIGYAAFAGCTALRSIVMSQGLDTIGYGAFLNCSSMDSFVLPSTVESIYTDAFRGCSDLTSITFESTTPPTLYGLDHFNNTNNCPIYVPAASVDTYKAASGWSRYASRIQAIPT